MPLFVSKRTLIASKPRVLRIRSFAIIFLTSHCGFAIAWFLSRYLIFDRKKSGKMCSLHSSSTLAGSLGITNMSTIYIRRLLLLLTPACFVHLVAHAAKDVGLTNLANAT